MGAPLLTTSSSAQCPHGGVVSFTTSNTRVRAAGAPVLLETDVHVVAGCAFTIGTKPSPCVRIQWTAASRSFKIGSIAALLQSSVGVCYSAEGAPQGVAIVNSTQSKAKGL
jgi:hypothetical protein